MTGRGTAEHRPTGQPRTDTQNQAMSGRGERRAGLPEFLLQSVTSMPLRHAAVVLAAV